MNAKEIPQQQPVAKKFNLFQSILTALIAGSIEVGANQPLQVRKILRQDSKPLPKAREIKEWYRGTTMSYLSMVPAVILQITSAYFIRAKILQSESDNAKMTAAFFGGVTSSIVACPTELLITQQLKHKTNLAQTYKTFTTQPANKPRGHTPLFYGLFGTGARNGIFTWGYFGMYPITKQRLVSAGYNELIATIVAGLASGVLSAVPSHVFDTPKTRQHVYADVSKITFFQATKSIYTEAGMNGLFKGLAPRTLKIISATAIMGTVTKNIESYIEKQEERRLGL